MGRFADKMHLFLHIWHKSLLKAIICLSAEYNETRTQRKAEGKVKVTEKMDG